MDEAALYYTISQASGKFAADAFTPYDVEGSKDGAGTGQTFCVTYTHEGQTLKKHFATVQLDEVACPSYAGTPTVARSQYSGQPAGDPPAAYGYPAKSTGLGSTPQLAAVTNYVALSATHFPLMQYGPEPNVAATTDVPEQASLPERHARAGPGLEHESLHRWILQDADGLRDDRAGDELLVRRNDDLDDRASIRTRWPNTLPAGRTPPSQAPTNAFGRCRPGARRH